VVPTCSKQSGPMAPQPAARAAPAGRSAGASSQEARVGPASSRADNGADSASASALAGSAESVMAAVGSTAGTQGSAASTAQPAERSQTERNYYLFVEPEDQMASIFQLCCRDATRVTALLATTIAACVLATVVCLSIYWPQ